MATKKCSKCGDPKELDEFGNDRSRKDGKSHRCLACARMANTQWYKEHPDKSIQATRRWQMRNANKCLDTRLRRDYGITREAYDAMVTLRSGLCDICKQPETSYSRGGKLLKLAIDHDHATGTIRGLLCRDCNTAIGLMRDQPTRFIAAADYLRHLEAPALAAEPLIGSAFAAPVAAASVVP